MTLFVALCMYLCVEAPLVQLELHLLTRQRQRQRQQTTPVPVANNYDNNGHSNTITPAVSLAVLPSPHTAVSQQNLVET